MNFKPTYVKLISALVLSVMISIWAYTSTMVWDAPQLIEPVKRQSATIAFIFCFILTYITVSLTERKKKK